MSLDRFSSFGLPFETIGSASLRPAYGSSSLLRICHARAEESWVLEEHPEFAEQVSLPVMVKEIGRSVLS